MPSNSRLEITILINQFLHNIEKPDLTAADKLLSIALDLQYHFFKRKLKHLQRQFIIYLEVAQFNAEKAPTEKNRIDYYILWNYAVPFLYLPSPMPHETKKDILQQLKAQDRIPLPSNLNANLPYVASLKWSLSIFSKMESLDVNDIMFLCPKFHESWQDTLKLLESKHMLTLANVIPLLSLNNHEFTALYFILSFFRSKLSQNVYNSYLYLGNKRLPIIEKIIEILYAQRTTTILFIDDIIAMIRDTDFLDAFSNILQNNRVDNNSLNRTLTQIAEYNNSVAHLVPLNIDQVKYVLTHPEFWPSIDKMSRQFPRVANLILLLEQQLPRELLLFAAEKKHHKFYDGFFSHAEQEYSVEYGKNLIQAADIINNLTELTEARVDKLLELLLSCYRDFHIFSTNQEFTDLIQLLATSANDLQKEFLSLLFSNFELLVKHEEILSMTLFIIKTANKDHQALLIKALLPLFTGLPQKSTSKEAQEEIVLLEHYAEKNFSFAKLALAFIAADMWYCFDDKEVTFLNYPAMLAYSRDYLYQDNQENMFKQDSAKQLLERSLINMLADIYESMAAGKANVDDYWQLLNLLDLLNKGLEDCDYAKARKSFNLTSGHASDPDFKLTLHPQLTPAKHECPLLPDKTPTDPYHTGAVVLYNKNQPPPPPADPFRPSLL